MDAQRIIEDIQRIQKTIESSEREIQRLEGQREVILKQLKKEFNVSSVEEAIATLEGMQESKCEAEQEIMKEYKKLKDTFVW